MYWSRIAEYSSWPAVSRISNKHVSPSEWIITTNESIKINHPKNYLHTSDIFVWFNTKKLHIELANLFLLFTLLSPKLMRFLFKKWNSSELFCALHVLNIMKKKIFSLKKKWSIGKYGAWPSPKIKRKKLIGKKTMHLTLVWKKRHLNW